MTTQTKPWHTTPVLSRGGNRPDTYIGEGAATTLFLCVDDTNRIFNLTDDVWNIRLHLWRDADTAPANAVRIYVCRDGHITEGDNPGYAWDLDSGTPEETFLYGSNNYLTDVLQLDAGQSMELYVTAEVLAEET